MKVPAGILQMIYKLVLANAGNIAEAPLEKIPHIDVIAEAYDKGEPLEVIVGLYIQATEGVKDDEIGARVGEVLEFIDKKVPAILAKVSESPFKDVLAELLGELAIPDFDETKGNEVKVIDVINNVLKELKA